MAVGRAWQRCGSVGSSAKGGRGPAGLWHCLHCPPGGAAEAGTGARLRSAGGERAAARGPRRGSSAPGAAPPPCFALAGAAGSALLNASRLRRLGISLRERPDTRLGGWAPARSCSAPAGSSIAFLSNEDVFLLLLRGVRMEERLQLCLEADRAGKAV